MTCELMLSEKEAKKYLRRKLKTLFEKQKDIYETALRDFKNLNSGDELHISYGFRLKKGF